jgi:hypothetical protein
MFQRSNLLAAALPAALQNSHKLQTPQQWQELLLLLLDVQPAARALLACRRIACQQHSSFRNGTTMHAMRKQRDRRPYMQNTGKHTRI